MIRAQGLVKKFGDFIAVDHIDFDVAKGEIFAFLGPNGAGKTTTIKMLTTLLRPTSGSVSLDGLDPVTDQTAARKQFGIVFQDPSVDDELTAYENMDFHGVLYGVPRKVRQERIEALLKLFELWIAARTKSNSFPEACGAGWRSRVASYIRLRSFSLTSPRLASTPKPATSFGPYKELNEEEHVTVFLTTHYMEEAERVAHRIAIIDHGKIIAQGTPGELKAQTGTETLEQAFLALTGSSIRDEEASGLDKLRTIGKAFRRVR